MDNRKKFPLLTEDGSVIFSEEELRKYKIVRKYIQEEKERENNSPLTSSDNDFFGGYGINLI